MVLVTLVCTYSMVSLAAAGDPIGDISLVGEPLDANAVVTVNGEPAKSGRTLFSSSLITTPAGVTAIVNLGTAGRIEISPESSFSVDSNGKTVTGSLANGHLTVLRALEPVGVTTAAGTTVLLNAGESANASSTRAARDHKDSTGKCIDDDNDGKEECSSVNPLIFLVIIGGVLGAVLAASGGGGGSNSGGGGISPTS